MRYLILWLALKDETMTLVIIEAPEIRVVPYVELCKRLGGTPLTGSGQVYKVNKSFSKPAEGGRPFKEAHQD